MAGEKFEVYSDRAGKWRWRLLGSNSQTVAASGESFASRANAVRAAKNVKQRAGGAEDPEPAQRTVKAAVAKKPKPTAAAKKPAAKVASPKKVTARAEPARSAATKASARSAGAGRKRASK